MEGWVDYGSGEGGGGVASKEIILLISDLQRLASLLNVGYSQSHGFLLHGFDSSVQNRHQGPIGARLAKFICLY